jgi:formylglycine-generating enzyme required for sulfatase activity
MVVLGLVVTPLLAQPCLAQQRDATAAQSPSSQRPTLYRQSWAVVVGVDRFRDPKVSRLNYAVNDARTVARALIRLGFPEKNIILLLNEQATRREVERVLGSVVRRATTPEDRLLIFFATHGVTLPLPYGGDEGYLLPSDADPDDLPPTALSMQQLKQIGQRIPAKHILIAVDACYGGYSLVRAQAPVLVDQRYLEMVGGSRVIQVMTAGKKDQPVLEEQGHGVFTRKFLDGLAGHADENRDGLITLSELGAWMHPRVAQASEYKQDMQWGTLDGEGQFVFVLPGGPATAALPAPSEPKVEMVPKPEYGALALSSKVPGVEVWLGDRRLGETRSGGELLVSDLAVGSYRLQAKREGYKPWEREVQVVANARADLVIDIELLGPPRSITAEDGAEMMLVPAGEFWMGSEAGDREAFDDEKPRHKVSLEAHYIDKYEVTNALYKRFMEATDRAAPSYWTDRTVNSPPQPAVGVSWHDAEAYCKWAGKRLPTAAEWEKAARGTDGRKYPWGDQAEPRRANAEQKSGKPLPVGSYPKGVSPYGIHDMAGNVSEWVQDWYAEDYYQRNPEANPIGPDIGRTKVLRGGSWSSTPRFLRSAVRGSDTPDTRDRTIGIRCAKGSTEGQR